LPTSALTLSDEELLTAAQAATGELRNELLSELFGRYYDQVSSWCLHFTRNQEDALDVAQEVFIKAHLSLDGFRQSSKVSTWLYVIARRTYLDLVRSRRRKPSEPLEQELESTLQAEGSDAFAEIDEKERAVALRRTMMAVLDEQERLVLCLRYIDGLTLPQITDRLGLENRSGAKAAIVSSFRKLRRAFP
jgi:RNA polymerase sigma-70 factor (ECF subfamily)